MRAVLIAAVLALAACKTAPIPPPKIIVQTVEVDRPVAVPCVDASDIPKAPPRVGDQLTGDAVHDADVLGAALLRAYALFDHAAALLGACTFSR